MFKKIWNLMNGKKTVTGLAGVAVALVAMLLGITEAEAVKIVTEILAGGSSLVALIGLIHKAIKAKNR